jgi:hypothetical protein
MNEQRWASLCSMLGFDSPRIVRFRRFPPKGHGGGMIYGQAQREPQRIFIYLCASDFDAASLRKAQHELVVTLLHELKHLQQFREWPMTKWAEDDKKPYSFKVSEREAESFAQAQCHTWNDVAKIKRVFRSTLTRLAEAESRVVR